MPLNLENNFVNSGAFRFGVLTSINALTVVFGTPILTKYINKMIDSSSMFIGEALEILGLSLFIFLEKRFYIAIVAMIIFTLGEIFLSVSQASHYSKRIPLSHRGRLLGLLHIFTSLIGTGSNYLVGLLLDSFDFKSVWIMISIIGVLLLGFYIVYIKMDRKSYPKLYVKNKEIR